MTDYVVTRAAQADLEQIIGWIAEDSPRAADRFEDALYDAFELLGRRPHIGHSRRDLTDRPVFFWTVMKSYAVIYRKAAPLEILRVVHWHQDIGSLTYDRH